MLISAQDHTGLDQLWETVVEHRATMSESGDLATLRNTQRLKWMWSIINTEIQTMFRSHPAVKNRLHQVETDVKAGRLPPGLAAIQLMSEFSSD